MAAKILCRSLELEPLHGFFFMFDLKEDLTLDVYCLVSSVILIIKTLFFSRFRILVDISVLFILAIIKIC